MRVLLTGGTGLLGSQLLRRPPSDWEIFATLHRDRLPGGGKGQLHTLTVDLTDPRQVSAAVNRIRPEVVIHLASLGNLEYCERHPEEAWAANVEATDHLLEASRGHDALFVFASSIYVFDGTRPPYDEQAAPNPLSHYARTKLEAETRVEKKAKRWIIFRPTPLYGWHRPTQRTNCVTWLLQRLEEQETLRIVDDIVNNPLWVEDAARALAAAVRARAVGRFHLGGPTSLSRYAFSRKAAEIFGHDPERISPASSEDFPTLAPRPRDTTCTTEKMEKLLGVVPLAPDQGLRAMLASRPARASEPLRASGSKGP